MKVSIITINLNNISGLRKTINSVLAQDSSLYEWIVIDGGSTDGSCELIEMYQDKITYWESEPDSGIYHAMNKGLVHAKADYIQFLNSGDSYIDGDVLQKVFTEKCLADINYGNQLCINGDGDIVEYRTYPEEISLEWLLRNPLGHQASFIRTTLAKNHLYKEKFTISADRAFFLELYLSGCQFHHLNFPVVVFDTEGIGSNINTLEDRRCQFHEIKRELLASQVVDDIERLMVKADEYDFVMRVFPLRLTYSLFKWLQKVKSSII